MSKTSVYEMVTERIITELQKGKIPWHKPWMNVYGKTEMSGAFNRITKKSYSMLNQMLLSQDGEYATFNQWKSLGGKIKKGAKSEIVVFWKILDKEVEQDGETKIEHIPMLRYYNVFHISQVENVKPLAMEGKIGDHAENSDAEADRIIADYVTREGIDFRETESDNAYYMPSKDMVVVPCREQYDRKNEFYSTTFHELVHSTGNVNRLNRIEKKAAYGNEEYSKEELVAEIGAASILNMLGIETPETFENSAAYIQSWISALQNDNRMIVSAGSRAEKAVEYILGENKPEKEEPETTEQPEQGNAETTDHPENNPVENPVKSQGSTEAENSASVAKPKKKSRKEKPETVYKRIAKEAGKMAVESLHKPSRFKLNGKEYLGFTEGHKIYATTKDYGYGESEIPINISALFEKISGGINRDMYKIVLDRENVAELERKSKKEGIKYPYIVHLDLDSKTDILIGINPKFALEAMDFTGENGFYINLYADCIKESSHYKEPLYFINADGEQENIALVLPININTIRYKIDQEGSYNPEN